MSGVTYKLTGMRELEQALAELPQSVRRSVGLKALRLAGEPVARVARAITRVDTGALRESIDVKTRLARSQRGDKGMVAPLEMYIGPGQHPQGITEEFGTFDQAAHPFLRPAWDANRENALDIVGAALGVEIDKAAKRLAKKAARGR